MIASIPVTSDRSHVPRVTSAWCREHGPSGVLRRGSLAAAIACCAFVVFFSSALAQWPTACVDLNDVVELQLGNHQNAGIYQRVFLGADAERACQGDHRSDVRSAFAWAFDVTADAADLPSTTWPTTCVGLNDFVEAHLGNTSNVGIYQRAFGDGPEAESACRADHRADVQAVFAWATGVPVPPLPRLTLPGGSPLALEDLADVILAPPWTEAMVYLRVPEGDDWFCGSGFVVTSGGYVVTNHHVIVDGPGWAEVRTSNGLLGQARVVASDPELDLALLKLSEDDGPFWFLDFGTSAALQRGDGVMVVGFPHCGSSGGGLIASWGGVLAVDVWATSRDTGFGRRSFRSNAPTETGSSGSPVLNQRGRVVGVHLGRGDEGASHLPGDLTRATIASWMAGEIPPVAAASGPSHTPSQSPSPTSQPAPSLAPSDTTAAQRVADALNQAGDALQGHYDAMNDFDYELQRAVRAANLDQDFTVGSALRSAADHLETAARELDTSALELINAVSLLRAHSLPNQEWALYLETASDNLSWAAHHLRDAAFNNRQASWNLRTAQATNYFNSANLALGSYESSLSSATSSLELWSISTS